MKNIVALAALTVGLHVTTAQAEKMTFMIKGDIVESSGPSAYYPQPSPYGTFAGEAGAFTMAFTYDPSVRFMGGSYIYGTDLVNYDFALTNVSLTFGGKVYSGRPFYETLAYSSQALSTVNGYAGVGFAYNFVNPDDGMTYYTNGTFFGAIADFFKGGSPLLQTGGEVSDLANALPFASNVNVTQTGSTYVSTGSLRASVSSISIAEVGAVPEPATWAMMLVGFGGIGFAMRRRKSKVATTVAYA